jgi:CRISPR-associated endonuclease Csy4
MNYIEITLQPTVEITSAFLLTKVMTRIHVMLTSMQDEEGFVPIALAFPQYSKKPPSLGTKLRIVTKDSNCLEELNIKHTLAIYRDYLHISGVREVPGKTEFVKFCRVQPKTSLERIARRKAKRENIPFEDALGKLESFKEQTVDLPYVQLKSNSSHRNYSLFIRKVESEESSDFCFNTFGLSKGGTVPDF